jgi:hypothetical protein
MLDISITAILDTPSTRTAANLRVKYLYGFERFEFNDHARSCEPCFV